jgi:membrane protease YdiL (CAAX protease family)
MGIFGMRTGWKLLVCLVALSVGIGAACAADRPDVGQAAEQVQARKVAAYRDALAGFDAAQAASPKDASIGVARCEFISRYIDADYDWIESASDDYDACTAMLAQRWPKAPEVALFELGNAWDDDALAKGEALIDAAKQWPKPMRARLFASLVDHAEGDARGAYALQAIALGDASQVAVAATHLADQRKYDEAARVLAQASPSTEPSRATARVKSALLLPDKQAALREALRHRKAGTDVYPDTLARAYLRAGQPKAARDAIAKVQADTGVWRALRFDIALAAKDWPAAVKLVDFTRGDEAQVSFQRFSRLAHAAPSTLLQGQMPFLLVGMIIVSFAMALVPGLLLLPVHYRGLSRRLRHLVSKSPFPRVTLIHTWYGLGVALAVPMLIALVLMPAATEGEAFGATLLRTMSWSMALGLLFLSPTLPAFDRRALLGDGALWRATWKPIVGLWIGLVALALLLNLAFTLLDADTTTDQVRMVAAVADQAHNAPAVMLTLVVIALVGPLFEEFVFRGLLLGGLARHLDFKWSNGLQAFGFACMHMDPPRFLFYFAMGLAGGWLVKRTGSLAPAVALHALNNAWAIGILMAM